MESKKETFIETYKRTMNSEHEKRRRFSAFVFCSCLLASLVIGRLLEHFFAISPSVSLMVLTVVSTLVSMIVVGIKYKEDK